MTIEEAQKLVDNWIKEKGVRYFNELTNTTILMEEVGELARVMSRKYGEQSTKKGEENLDLADELADVMWVLICIANHVIGNKNKSRNNARRSISLNSKNSRRCNIESSQESPS